MKPHAIVIHLDVVGDCALHFVAGCINSFVNGFVFEAKEEALGDGVDAPVSRGRRC